MSLVHVRGWWRGISKSSPVLRSTRPPGVEKMNIWSLELMLDKVLAQLRHQLMLANARHKSVLRSSHPTQSLLADRQTVLRSSHPI